MVDVHRRRRGRSPRSGKVGVVSGLGGSDRSSASISTGVVVVMTGGAGARSGIFVLVVGMTRAGRGRSSKSSVVTRVGSTSLGMSGVLGIIVGMTDTVGSGSSIAHVVAGNRVSIRSEGRCIVAVATGAWSRIIGRSVGGTRRVAVERRNQFCSERQYSSDNICVV